MIVGRPRYQLIPGNLLSLRLAKGTSCLSPKGEPSNLSTPISAAEPVFGLRKSLEIAMREKADLWGEKRYWASFARSRVMISAIKSHQLYAFIRGSCPKLGGALPSCIESIKALLEDEGTIGYED